jgi:hypothetical protein
MDRFSKFLSVVTIFSAATLLAGVAWGNTVPANMVTNPGFETGNFTGWNSYGTWYVSDTPDDVHSGTYAAVNSLTVAAGTTSTTYSGLYQNIADPNAAGRVFDASVWISTAVTNGYSDAFLQLQFQNASGSVLQQYETTPVRGDQAYSQYSLSNLVAPSGTAIIQMQGVVNGIGGLTLSTSNTGYTRFDSFSLTAVPEPASAALMTLGIAGFALVCRRRSSLTTPR